MASDFPPRGREVSVGDHDKSATTTVYEVTLVSLTFSSIITADLIGVFGSQPPLDDNMSYKYS